MYSGRRAVVHWCCWLLIRVRVTKCTVDDVRSCIDATDSSGTLTNDESYVTPLRHRHSSECDRSCLSVGGMLQLDAASDSVDTAKKHTSASRCSICSQDQAKNNNAEGCQLKAEPQLSEEERQSLELQRSRGAIPKCHSDHRPCSHSGIFLAWCAVLGKIFLY